MKTCICFLVSLCAYLNVISQTISPAGPVTFCINGNLTVTGATGSPNYQWQLNGVNIGGNNATLNVNAPGNYTVILSGTPPDTLGPVVVSINPPPVPTFTFTNNNTCSGTSISFNSTVTSGTPPYSYSWDFGDGGVSAIADPTHIYTALGCGSTVFNAVLIVTDALGCVRVSTQNINVLHAPDVILADTDIFGPFSNCENNPTVLNPNYTLTLNNASPNPACISTYTVNWGDGNTQVFTGASFPIAHTYTQLGAYNLSVTALGTNGCSYVRTYVVANQTNPAGGLGTLGQTTGLCAPSTIPFIISNWQNNSPGTIYVLQFGDGNQVTLPHPLNATNGPDTVNHQYTTSSCPLATFTATLLVINACDTTPYTAGNIQVRISPVASFTANPNPGCAGTAICFTNTTVPGTFGATCLTTTAYTWNFGDPASGANNTSTLQNPCHTFSAPGTYTVTLTSSNPCGPSVFSMPVCVAAPPVPAFTIDVNTGCAPLNVMATNTSNVTNSCNSVSYLWSVSYASGFCNTAPGFSFTNGTNANSINPSFQFTNGGTYTIMLAVTNPCGTFTTTRIVTVKRPPTVTINPITSACAPSTIHPVANITNCGSTAPGYLWTMIGATPSSSSNADPGNIIYNSPGMYTITLAVTNECGTTTASQPVTVNQTPDINLLQNVAVCAGAAVGPFTFTSTSTGATFSWTNTNINIGLGASGPNGNIGSFTATNAGATAITGTITSTATLNGCSSNSSFNITVNPLPAMPAAANVIYCQNATATALTATALPGHTLLWYTVSTGGTGSVTAPIPSTATTGTTPYYVSQVNSTTNCEGPRRTINVTVNVSPIISGHTFINPATCASSTGSITLTGLGASVSYTVSYTFNSGPVTTTISSTPGGNVVIPNLAAGSYNNIQVTALGCPSNLIGPVTLSDPSAPAAPVAGNSGPVCSGQNITLTSTAAPAGATYNWSGPGGYSSTVQNPVITAATTGASGTYTLSHTQNGCTSPAVTTLVVVNPTPLAPTLSSNSPVCAGNTLNLNASTTFAGAVTWQWNGPNAFTSSLEDPTIVNVTTGASGTYNVILTASTGSCASTAAIVNVTVKPTPVIGTAVAVNPTQCATSNGTITLTGLPVSSAFIINYTLNSGAQSTSFNSDGSGNLVMTGLGAGLYENISVVLNGCPSLPVGPFTLSDPFPPATPVAGNGGAICSGQNISLTSSAAPAGGTYNWSGPGGYTSNQQNPIITSAPVTAAGTYTVSITLNNCTSVSASTVVVVNPSPPTPAASSNSPICAGNPLNLNAAITFAGAVTWSWSGPNGFANISQNPSIPAATTAAGGTYNVTATAVTGNCSSTAGSTIVTVKPTPVIATAVSTDPAQCSSATGLITLTGLIASSNYVVTYTFNTAPQTTNLSSDINGVLVIPNLEDGTYNNIVVSLNGCPSLPAGPVTLTDPSPPLVPGAVSSSPVCSGNTLTLTATNNSAGTPTYAWTGPNGFTSNVAMPQITNVSTAASGTYQVTVTITGCTSPAAFVIVLIDSTPVMPVITNNGPVCSDSTLTLSATTISPGSMTWLWTGPNGFTSTLQNPLITNSTTAAAGTYSVTATATQGNCNSAMANSLIVIYSTPVISATSVIHPTLCNTLTGSILLNGLLPNTTYSVSYTLSSVVSILSLTSNGAGTVVIPNLGAGTYSNVFVELNGCKSLASGPFILTDPNPPAAPNVSSNGPVCSGQSLSLQVSTPAPGSATFNWTGPNGFLSTLANPVIAFTSAASGGTYNVTVTINNCISLPASLPVVIHPLPAAPSVISPVTYCINTTAIPLTANPAAGNPLNWYTIPLGGTANPIAPTPSTTTSGSTSYYVSQVNSFGCEGPRDTIRVQVNPDAIAQFVPTDTIGCPPFIISPAVLGLQLFPANNSSYQWYVNNVFIGSGAVFPGHTIVGENSSVSIKLVATSLFGCKADSMSQVFNTYNLPHPSFDLVDTVGCGPLTVQVINTTPNINLFTYFWDFGNGQTSTLQQPGSVIFLSNPTYNDTIYTVSQQIFSICDTITVTRTVRVKSKPKALFTPSQTTGCSPMNVSFQNTSLGSNSTFYWDFGDGTTLVNNTLTPVQHTYNTGLVDTFYVKLVAINECGSDSITYSLIVSPNNIFLNFAVNGPDHFGCAPHTVAFINNTSGASSFNWDFGDGNILNTTANIDTVYHTYLTSGNFIVNLTALNSCTDTTTTDFINVFAKPIAGFTASNFTQCQGLPVSFTNQSSGGTSYLWEFGDGATSTLLNPVHSYANPGIYNVKLTVFSANAPGNICNDTLGQQVQVVSSLPGQFTMSAVSATCAPLTVTFVNQNRPSVTSNWTFGDGAVGVGDSVVHTYTLPGIYNVVLTVTVPGGCTYTSTRVVTINGPAGSLQYTGGYACYPNSVRLQATGTNFDTVHWNFGDGNTLSGTQLVVFHNYTNPGIYLPTVTFQNTAGCDFVVPGIDTIKVDRIDAGYTFSKVQQCGYTRLLYNDTSNVFFGTSLIKWNFGDGNTGTGPNVSHNYFISGTYQVEMIIIGISGCTDTILKPISIQVNSLPVSNIVAPLIKCTGETVNLTSVIQSTDPINFMQWTISNGVNSNGASLDYIFTVPGTYTIRFIAGTGAGCFDTTFHTIVINQAPQVTASASTNICLGNSTNLIVTGAQQYQWSPPQGLSCTTCSNPVAAPIITTPYVVTGTNSVGCSVSATVVVTVIQPLAMNISPADTICIGQSANLLASGAASYVWSPAQDLNDPTLSNPVATPTVTTRYKVVGYDGFNCFTDTAFVLVAVGRYPVVNLGPDLNLAAGTLHPLITTVVNGPVKSWQWTEDIELSCNTCPLPTALIKKDITYIVNIRNMYDCPGSDTINIKVFCADAQVFIPNAFTPDGDSKNDILMVRGKGIQIVKSFRIFNRWGEVVFDKYNFPPNSTAYGWNGKVKGVAGPPDVFVYTAEVTCENGTSFTYKGNVSLIK